MGSFYSTKSGSHWSTGILKKLINFEPDVVTLNSPQYMDPNGVGIRFFNRLFLTCRAIYVYRCDIQSF